MKLRRTATALAGLSAAPAADRPILIRDARVVDGTGTPAVIENVRFY